MIQNTDKDCFFNQIFLKYKSCAKHNSWLHHLQGHFRNNDVIIVGP